MKIDDFDITHIALTERGIEIGGAMRPRIIVDPRMGPGEFKIVQIEPVWIDRDLGGTWALTWERLWVAMWAAVAAAIYVQANGGRCRCGCTAAACTYCIGECFDG